jgi:hypothetical protein
MMQAPDALLVAAVDLARTAAIAEAGDPELVGVPVGVEADDERLVTHLFEASLPGYTAWRWAVTIARTEDVTNLAGLTICDVVLLPGPDALMAPEWIPYEQRVLPGDLGVGDLLPTHADDLRLVPGYASLPEDEELDPAQLWELGLGRARVLSSDGRDSTAKRWYSSDRGPHAEIALNAPLPCGTCGFFLPIAGSLRAAFGVCSNEFAPDDARVVSSDHGCGAHSQALIVE